MDRRRQWLTNSGRSRRLAVAVGALLIILAAGYVALRPRPAYALVRDTTITVLTGRVELWTAEGRGYVALPLGTRSTPLRVGDRVRTGPDGHAVLTYFEGSTTEIEPNSEITVTELQRASGPSGTSSLRLAIYAWSGTIWNKVVRMVDPNAQFSVGTSSAVIAVRGTAFQVAVGTTAGGQAVTTVDAQEGVVSVAGQGQTVEVGPGEESSVVQGQPPAPPAPAPPPASTLRIGVGSPANLFACDALGRCIGFYRPAGVTVNTVPNAWYSGPDEEPEIAGLPNPSGTYRLSLQAAGDGGEVHLSVAGWNSQAARSEQTRVLTLRRGQSSTATFSVSRAADGTLRLSTLSGFRTGGAAAGPPQPFALLLDSLVRHTAQQVVSTATTAPPWVPVGGFADAPAGTRLTVQAPSTSGTSTSTTRAAAATTATAAASTTGRTSTGVTSSRSIATSAASTATSPAASTSTAATASSSTSTVRTIGATSTASRHTNQPAAAGTTAPQTATISTTSAGATVGRSAGTSSTASRSAPSTSSRSTAAATRATTSGSTLIIPPVCNTTPCSAKGAGR